MALHTVEYLTDSHCGGLHTQVVFLTRPSSAFVSLSLSREEHLNRKMDALTKEAKEKMAKKDKKGKSLRFRTRW